ncbi:MAG: hypothetical protein IT314_14940 [Anaerolineales bacterium]|nr:hypothetical protein [Anaerolineales bacterium]
MKLFTLLDEYDLTKPKSRIKNLINLSQNDLEDLIDALSGTFTEKESMVSAGEQANPWDLWLPFFSNTTLEQIPCYLVAFDKVCMLDPLVDYLYELQKPNISLFSKFSKNLIGKSENLPKIAEITDPKVLSILLPLFDQASWNIKLKEFSARKIDAVINYYLKYKELIQENALVPYVDLSSDYSEYAVGMLYMVENLVYEIADKHSILEGQYSEEITKYNNDPQGLVNLLENEMSIFWSERSEVIHFMPAALDFKSSFPSNTSPSITFGDKQNKVLLDSAIELLSKSLKNEKIENIKWPNHDDEIIFPSLSGIPSENLLNFRRKEKEAFEKYRYYTQKKLLEMKAVAGTKEYTSLIKSFQIEQKAQIAEISLLYKNIKSNLQRKTTHHIGSVTLSVAATVLAALSTTSDPITLLGIGVGSSGAMMGIEKLIEDWITFQSEKDKLKEKDTYILWRANQQ